jgi:Na+-driven multidrug efflux pump
MAFGDIRFTLITSAISVWVFGVAPGYLLALEWKQPANVVHAGACLYYFVTGAAYLFRVRSRLRRSVDGFCGNRLEGLAKIG